MSVTQRKPEQSEAGPGRCNRCNTVLPREATFCGQCGERVNKQGDATSSPSNTTVEERYRNIGPVRQSAQNIQSAASSSKIYLSRALDIQQKRLVLIRDIDVSTLPETERAQAIEIVQNEYDQLRQQKHMDIMSVIDQHYYEQHIYTIANWPQVHKPIKAGSEQLTLQNLLESGIGLPDEDVALTWAYRISQAVQRLHEQQIVLGDLDPQTVAVNGRNYDGLPVLMVSWIPEEIRHLLQAQDSHLVIASPHFSAPEVLRGEPEARSDIYSIGAILYLLLTGSAPDSETRKIREPRELKPEVSSGISQVVMQALAYEPTERFYNAEEFAIILLGLCSSTKTISPDQLAELHAAHATKTEQEAQEAKEQAEASTGNGEPDSVTVKVTPLQIQQAHWYLAQLAPDLGKDEGAEQERKEKEQKPKGLEDSKNQQVRLPEVPSTEESVLSEEELKQAARMSIVDMPTTPFPTIPQTQTGKNGQLIEHFRQRFSGQLPVISSNLQKTIAAAANISKKSGKQQLSWFRRLKRFILGEQQRITTAAAIIEAPLRIQPGQGYTLRIHLLGRDNPPTSGNEASPGLSGLVHGEQVHIEVRSALYQNFAYVVQQADVEIPSQGYAAEVSIPMQPLSEGPNGRRERLHILFKDQLKRPLYERPFVIEIYTSHMVHAGQEGYSALTIPL
jgi:serine/threonine protein kinase